MSNWTAERVERMRAMYANGSSCSEIARALGDTTRNAVLGKLHRLGALRADTGAQAKRVATVAIPPGPKRNTPGASLQALVGVVARKDPGLPPIVEVLTATVTDWSRGECRWPIGDPGAPGYGYCGRCVDLQGRYCATHAATGRAVRQTKPLSDSAVAYHTRNEAREPRRPAPRPLGILGDRWAPDW